MKIKLVLLLVAVAVVANWVGVAEGRMREMEANRKTFQSVPWQSTYDRESWTRAVEAMRAAGGWVGLAANMASQGYIIGIDRGMEVCHDKL